MLVGRCGARRCGRRGGQTESLDPKSLDSGDECHRSALSTPQSFFHLSVLLRV